MNEWGLETSGAGGVLGVFCLFAFNDDDTVLDCKEEDF